MKGIFSYKSLRLSYERVIRSSTNDVRNLFGESVYKFNLKKNLENLSESLVKSKYKPSKPFKYYEPKTSGTQRVKTVLNIEDSIVYQAIANHIAVLVGDELKTTNKFVFGNILHENVSKGNELLNEFAPEFHFFKKYIPLFNEFVKSINKQIEQNDKLFKLDTDITSFFDSISHSSLAFILQDFKIEPTIIDFLLECLNTWSGTRNSPTFQVGIPQGPIASFFFANLILHKLDKKMLEKGFSYYRYTDDIKVYSSSNDQLKRILLEIDLFLKDHSLSLNSKKTLINSASINKSEEYFQLLKNQSTSELILVDKEKEMIQSEFLTKVNDDELTEYNIDQEDAVKIISNRLKGIEEGIFNNFYFDIKNGKFQSDDLDVLESKLIELGYLWRTHLRMLKDFEGEYDFDYKLVNIWIAGMNTFFWRSNHFCWNLKNYNLKRKDIVKIFDQKNSIHRFEWCTYQINNLLNNPNILKIYGLGNVSKKIILESSPLIRLSLYKILLNNYESDSNKFKEIIESIKDDSENYIRYTLLDWLNYFSPKKISSELINKWFGA